jgi:hypothetical protein
LFFKKGKRQRANVIVREYRVRQHIPFHLDELECGEMVIGMILLNEDEKQRGLCFRKGEGDKTLQYTVQEEPGTIFSLTGESRYSWTHGLMPCNGRRISVTVRFYKDEVISKWRREMELLDKSVHTSNPDAVSEQVNLNVRITLVDAKSNAKKPVVVAANSTRDDLLLLFKNKLKLKPKVLLVGGVEWMDGQPIKEGDLIFGK